MATGIVVQTGTVNNTPITHSIFNLSVNSLHKAVNKKWLMSPSPINQFPVSQSEVGQSPISPSQIN
jgi:hypothetical protein